MQASSHSNIKSELPKPNTTLKRSSTLTIQTSKRSKKNKQTFKAAKAFKSETIKSSNIQEIQTSKHSNAHNIQTCKLSDMQTFKHSIKSVGGCRWTASLVSGVLQLSNTGSFKSGGATVPHRGCGIWKTIY